MFCSGDVNKVLPNPSPTWHSYLSPAMDLVGFVVKHGRCSGNLICGGHVCFDPASWSNDMMGIRGFTLDVTNHKCCHL